MIFDKKKVKSALQSQATKKLFVTICSSQQCGIFWIKQIFGCSNGILAISIKVIKVLFLFFVYRGLRGHFNIWRATKKLLSPCLFVLSRFVFLKNMKILWSQLFSGYLRITVFFWPKKEWKQPFRLKLQKNILSLFVHLNNAKIHPLVFPTINIWHSKIQETCGISKSSPLFIFFLNKGGVFLFSPFGGL